MTTQDFESGVDFTLTGVINATQLNQAINNGRAGDDKGLVITSTDTAEDTPVVPDPDGDYSGVTPTWWTRYIWVRKVYGGGVYAYAWDDEADSDATYLQWIRVDADNAEALASATEALATANAANAAVTNLGADLSAFETRLETAEEDISNNTNEIISVRTRVTSLEAQASGWRTGDLRTTFSNEAYSETADEGWLECNGASVPIATFGNLYNVLGSTFGETTTNFTLPDLRGRTIIGTGVDGALTDRYLGETGGAESVTLTPAQVQHKHLTGALGTGGSDTLWLPSTDVTTVTSYTAKNVHSDQSISTGALTQANTQTLPAIAGNAATPHSNMQPYVAARILIKT